MTRFTVRQARSRLPKVCALLVAAAAALVLRPAVAQVRAAPRGPGRAYPHRRVPFRTANIERENRKTPAAAAMGASMPAVSADVVSDWVGGLLQQTSTRAHRKPVQNLAVQEAAKLLVAVGSVVRGAAGASDISGYTYVADAFDMMDAQAIIAEGQATTASLWLDEGLVNLKLALQDGTEHIITLLSAE
jgi:hypothetical protein|mmetsp:Transcript_70249/g.206024  ORF Transcript_70249/g.206024 Transcript_70249/m.206024 type:complete len:189 (-) Transcript_70249:362-928(-)